MKITRRTFVKLGGGAIGSFFVGKVVAQEITEFSTLESTLTYKIEHGRVNPITLVEGAPPLPPYPPAEIPVDWGNVIIKWNLARKMEDPGGSCVNCDPVPAGEDPQWINLWLFKPKSSITDIDTIVDPPQYSGHGPKGHYTLRYPLGDNTYPVKEATPLWQDYIAPNWELIPGADVTIRANDSAERDNTTWPGDRRLARWVYSSSDFGHGGVVPLRVAIHGLGKRTALLALVEIKKKGRLRLMVRPMIIKPVIHSQIICFIATAAYGSSLAPELDLLRYWRDNKLNKHLLGRMFVRMYYLISPSVARVIEKSENLKRLTRFLLNPLVKKLSKSYSGKTYD